MEFENIKTPFLITTKKRYEPVMNGFDICHSFALLLDQDDTCVEFQRLFMLKYQEEIRQILDIPNLNFEEIRFQQGFVDAISMASIQKAFLMNQ